MAEVNATKTANADEEVKTSAKVKAEAKVYVCTKPCYWLARLWKPGDEITTGKAVPSQFELKK